MVKNVLPGVLPGRFSTLQVTHTLYRPTHSRFCFFFHRTTAPSSLIKTSFGKCCSAKPSLPPLRKTPKHSKVLCHPLFHHPLDLQTSIKVLCSSVAPPPPGYQRNKRLFQSSSPAPFGYYYKSCTSPCHRFPRLKTVAYNLR